MTGGGRRNHARKKREMAFEAKDTAIFVLRKAILAAVEIAGLEERHKDQIFPMG